MEASGYTCCYQTFYLNQYIQILKSAPSKKTFSKLLPPKIHFLKIAPSKQTFLKLLPQKRHFQNCSLKKYIFSKLLYQNYSLKEDIFKKCICEIAFVKNINHIALIYFSSESSQSSDEFSKSSIICVMYLHSFKILVGNSFHLY